MWVVVQPRPFERAASPLASACLAVERLLLQSRVAVSARHAVARRTQRCRLGARKTANPRFLLLSFVLVVGTDAASASAAATSAAEVAAAAAEEETWEDYAADDEELEQPPQMTGDWWDLHYQEVFNTSNLTGNPLIPGTLGGDLTDQKHFDAANACVEELLEPLRRARQTRGRTLKVLVLGCGISPLVFLLADRGYGEVGCIDISKDLVTNLQGSARQVPRPPRFAVADITSVSRRRRVGDHGSPVTSSDGHKYWPRSIDVVIDENVLDGLACRFPHEAGMAALEMALDGIRWFLRPSGRLLTLSFVPFDQYPYVTMLSSWAPVKSSCSALSSLRGNVHANTSEDLHLKNTIHVAAWRRPTSIKSSGS